MGRVSDFPEELSPSSGDYIPLVDTSAGRSKRVSVANLGTVIGGGGGEGGSGFTYVSASGSAPASPVEDDTWYQTDTGKSFVRVGSSWVEFADNNALIDVSVPGDIDATGTASASTSLHGDGVWRSPTAVARVSMTTPDPPSPGDTRWNPDLDPPTTAGGGGDFGASDVYLTNKDMFVSGTNMSVVTNDVTETITFNSTASGGSGDGLGFQALNAVDYGLSQAGSAAANTSALRNCVNAAVGANVSVFIPAGRYLVGNQCLTPTLGSAAIGLHIFGEGPYQTILEMERNNGDAWFVDNDGNGNTTRFMKFNDLQFTGGPTDTGTQRANTNEQCLGFRIYGANGASDQSYKFTRCFFRTMRGVWESWGQNNASEIGFTDCKMSHISGWVMKSDNWQALNWFFLNCDVEFVWGAAIWFLDSGTPSGTPGGGAVGVFGGSWIVQDDGGDSGALIRVTDGAPVTCTVSFFGTRVEVRNNSTVVDASDGGLLTVNFNGCTFFTIVNSGPIQTVSMTENQFVGYTRCTFEHNGSYATYVNAGGRLVFNECAVRPTIQSEVTTSNGGVSKAKDCYERFNFTNTIEWSE